MTIPFQCTCGQLRGEIDPRAVYVRAVCYCLDCQAYAHVLGREDVLDGQGGSDIIAMQPGGLRFTAGTDRLACLSLSPKGPLRWHSACCNMPIANTARTPALPYAGVLVACLATSAQALDAAFGPARTALNTDSAAGRVAATPVRTAAGIARIILGVVRAKLGRTRESPFFESRRSQPRVLTLQERAAATPPRRG
ncbi:hypothetical protein E5843_06960 [Luteimonas yindakuii]|uniref:DUF6151 family protein n=1 Tax=Luteimonas yindakuii TaxID=2565782 RepID=UPI0010A40EB6|nr:DUF6151 family protein [Luteimonas yindakuii]QCO67576.1 hypothetical protein E5843_06960 [Luteimonas yindakuii]